MITAAIPDNEVRRLKELRDLEILDTSPEASFDRITSMAARLFGVPICVISLVDENREWFKSACGIDAKEGSRTVAFCSHTILRGEVMVVEDARVDARFHDNPLVTQQNGIRFYAGAPMVSRSGLNLGAFCLKDHFPRSFTLQEKWMLLQFAEIVVELMEFRHLAKFAHSATRAKSDFLANMSHEIRTPINGILGLTELTLESKLSRDQRENLGMVKRSALSLLQVINDILDFSKIEAGRLELDPTPFSLRDTLRDTMKAQSLRAHEKNLELICHLKPDLPDALVGDSLRLRQILTNLVGNAIKFTERGEVVVRIDAKERRPGKVNLHCSVRDTGIGIPADKQRVIFESFTQADASMARKFGGTGLGLAITSQLVNLMEGRLWVESEAGVGSNFHFTVCLECSDEPTANSLSSPVELDRMPVLVVDDNAAHREMLTEVLTNWRMCPTAVPDGAAAIAATRRAVADSDPFRLILLDANMPDPNGFAVAEDIRRDQALDGAIIMMLSSADHRGDAARSQELGVTCYIRKPIGQSELFDAIQTALGGRTSEDPEADAATNPGVDGRVRSLRILLAEDNEVNQSLAVKTLQKRGHAVVIANDGLEALDAWGRDAFDIILMDVQMPGMDGFAATAAIREREKATGAHIPIVALTAHAMKGDRELCLKAGMDDYVSKPLDIKELLHTMDRLFSASGRTTAADDAENPPAEDERSTDPVFDLAAVMDRVEGDRALLQEMTTLFISQSGDWMADIRAAAELGKGDRLERAAHKLKGAIGPFNARSAVMAAQLLENIGRNQDFDQASEAIADLENEVSRLIDALKPLAKAGDHANSDR